MLDFIFSFQFATGIVVGVVFAVPLKAAWLKAKAKYQVWRASKK